jgi:hypothetical protein
MMTEQITRNGTEVGIMRKETDASGVYLHFTPTRDHTHPISFQHRDELNTYLDREFPISNSRPLADRVAIHDYLTGGYGTFTMLNTQSGNRFTFKVSSPKGSDSANPPHFVAILTGSDNNSDYQYLGQFRVNGNRLNWSHGRKSSIDAAAKSAVSIAWFFNALNADRLPSFLKVLHEGTCCRCGRKLTTPESIEAGIGPVCATKD